MRLAVLFVALGIIAGIWIFWVPARRPLTKGESKISARGENTPLCPWREPQQDLKALFPEASAYATETRILSGFTAPLQKRLGRSMTVDENPLRIHRATDGARRVGAILVKRVKGEHGGIELVMGLDNDGRVRGVLIQSQREPDSVAQIIATLLPHFAGKTAKSPFKPGDDLPEVAPEARVTATAVAEGVRSTLIVFSFAEDPGAAQKLVEVAP